MAQLLEPYPLTNLYKAVGVADTASYLDIEAALLRLPASPSRSGAAAILLNPNLKAVYDNELSSGSVDVPTIEMLNKTVEFAPLVSDRWPSFLDSHFAHSSRVGAVMFGQAELCSDYALADLLLSLKRPKPSKATDEMRDVLRRFPEGRVVTAIAGYDVFPDETAWEKVRGIWDNQTGADILHHAFGAALAGDDYLEYWARVAMTMNFAQWRMDTGNLPEPQSHGESVQLISPVSFAMTTTSAMLQRSYLNRSGAAVKAAAKTITAIAEIAPQLSLGKVAEASDRLGRTTARTHHLTLKSIRPHRYTSSRSLEKKSETSLGFAVSARHSFEHAGAAFPFLERQQFGVATDLASRYFEAAVLTEQDLQARGVARLGASQGVEQ